MTSLLGNTTARLSVGRRAVLIGGAAALAASATSFPASLRAAPRKGGLFRVSVSQGGIGDSLDPATFTGSQQIVISWAVRNNLTEVGSDGNLRGELAESWQSDDAMTWILKLRSGIEFHNGKPLTPEDVIASLNLHRDENSKSGAKALLDTIVEITAEGSDAVRVVLNGPNADFPFILSDYHFSICPVASDGSLDVSGVGTGGYVLENFEPGVKTRLRRNPNYWKAGAANFDEAEVLLITDSTSSTNALVTGQIHAVQNTDYKTLGHLSQQDDITVESVPSGFHGTWAMNTGLEPFNNNDVRLALKYAVDRQKLVDTIFKGHAIVANDHPVSPAMPYYDPTVEQRAYDPEKAKFHLKQAGLSKLEVSLSVADSIYAGAVDAVTLYREHAAPSGLDVKIVREPGDGYWSDVWMKKPFFASSWGPRPVPDMILTTAYASGAAWNESAFSHAHFDELLVAARGELDESKRASMYGEIQRILSDEGGSVIPFFRNYVFGRRKDVAHSGQLGPDWPLDGYRAVERWWMA